MIRLNLIPREGRKVQRVISDFNKGVILVLAIVGVCLILYLYQYRQLSEVMERTAWVQKRLKELEEIKKKVDDYKARNAELERRIKLIQELEDNRTGPLFVMDSLSKSIPERSWINKFTETGYSAQLQGIAWNEFTVSDFLKNLQASKYFGNVELKSIKKQIMQDLPLRSFVINASLNYSGKTKENVDTSKGKAVKEKG